MSRSRSQGTEVTIVTGAFSVIKQLSSVELANDNIFLLEEKQIFN